ncbi:MAG: hypothetical protein AAFQ63_15730 [Cyanobacteria bacterium J06621_11]
MPLKETPCRIKNPELWAIARLDAAIVGIRDGEQITPVEAVGVHAVMTALAKTVSCKDAEVKGVLLGPSKRRIDLLISSSSGRARELIDQWIAAVAQLKHAPSDWTLNVYLDDETVAVRSIQLPRWYVSADDF